MLIINSALADHKPSHKKVSPEIKGIIGGGGVTTFSAITFGVSIAGITAIFPLALIGSTVGYFSVKTNKKYKIFKKRPKKTTARE